MRTFECVWDCNWPEKLAQYLFRESKRTNVEIHKRTKMTSRQLSQCAGRRSTINQAGRPLSQGISKSEASLETVYCYIQPYLVLSQWEKSNKKGGIEQQF